ncbi:hypothetical protein [Lentzea nigeriaca]|nr:hypothetical protein [Lentzea nigeriaca]MBM7859107.1 hypothetical protein [Lentzea nigeriaca]
MNIGFARTARHRSAVTYRRQDVQPRGDATEPASHTGVGTR